MRVSVRESQTRRVISAFHPSSAIAAAWIPWSRYEAAPIWWREVGKSSRTNDACISSAPSAKRIPAATRNRRLCARSDGRGPSRSGSPPVRRMKSKQNASPSSPTDDSTGYQTHIAGGRPVSGT